MKPAGLGATLGLRTSKQGGKRKFSADVHAFSPFFESRLWSRNSIRLKVAAHSIHLASKQCLGHSEIQLSIELEIIHPLDPEIVTCIRQLR